MEFFLLFSYYPHTICKDFFDTFYTVKTSFVVVISVMCETIRKLLVAYGRKQVQLQNVCKNKKDVMILLLEFLNEDHILHFFSSVQRFF